MAELLRKLEGRAEWWVPTLFALFSGLWIYFSDALVASISLSIENQRISSTYKGFTYVLITTVLLYVGIRAALRRERTEAKKAIEAQRFTDQIINGVQEGVIVYGPDLRYLVWNPFMEQLTGIPAKDVIGRHPIEVFPFLQEAGTMDHLNRALAGQQVDPIEFPFQVQGTGKNGWTINASVPLRNSQGDIIGVIATVTDITERRQAEDKLSHSHELMRYIIEHCQEAVAVHDRDMRYIYVSQQYLQDYKVVGQDLIGRHHYEVMPDLPQKWRDVHQKALAGVSSSADGDEWARADGTVEWTRWECRPWYEANGSIGGIIVYTELVSERMRAERALLESKNRLKKAQQVAHVGSWTWNLKTGSIDWSDEMYRIFGVEKDTFHGVLSEVIAQSIHPDDRAAVEQSNLFAAQHGKPTPLEYRVIRPGGTMRVVWAEVGELILDESGNLAILTWIVQDITERKQAEDVLRTRTGELATLFEVSRDLSATLDLQVILQTATDRIAELTDLKSAAVYLLSDEKLRLWATTPPLPPEFPEELRLAELADHPHIHESMASRKAIFLPDTSRADLTAAEQAVCEARGLRSILYMPLISGVKVLGVLIVSSVEGPRVPSEAGLALCQTLANVAAIAIENGQMYEASQTNAAELKREIIERKRAEAALEESARHYRDLFDQANEGLVIMTSEGHLVEVNRAFAEMHGYSMEEMNGMDIQSLDVLRERVMEDRIDIARRVLNGEVVRFEVAHYHKDGHAFPLSVTSSLIHLNGTSYFLAFHQDLTERIQTEENHRKLQAQFQQSQKMESLGTLAGGVAHDMNNVLGAILGLASAHIGTQPQDSPMHQALDTICRAAERGGKMVKSLLSFARQNPAEIEELDMNVLLREQVALLERTTLAKVRINMDLGADLRPIQGDVGALTHAVMNLCVNAVDAMSENGILTLHTRNVENDWVELVVEDNGMGMPQEVLEKALDPFFTTKGVGKGTGLGLSMVFSTVKAHRGQMSIESEPAHGTRVKLRFPACVKNDQGAEKAFAGSTEIPTGGMKVLVVDDDELIQSSTLAVLEFIGHKAVTSAQSGEEALTMLEEGFEPDLIILDMNMPGLGGVGTLPLLRILRPEVPVLLATGRTDQAALSLASSHPGVTLLAKPFGLRELQKHLEAIGLG